MAIVVVLLLLWCLAGVSLLHKSYQYDKDFRNSESGLLVLMFVFSPIVWVAYCVDNYLINKQDR